MYHTKYQFARPAYMSPFAPITCQDSVAGASQEGWAGYLLSEQTGMEGLDLGLVVMLEGRGGRGAAMQRGKTENRKRHQGEKRAPEQVLESSGSKENWWRQKLKAGADQGWQASPQRKEVCEGEVADDLVGLCVPHSCMIASWQSRCPTKFCTGVVVVAQL